MLKLTSLQMITELEKRPASPDRDAEILQCLMNHARLTAGWKHCPECGRWHEPMGMSLLACGCGHSFIHR